MRAQNTYLPSLTGTKDKLSSQRNPLEISLTILHDNYWKEKKIKKEGILKAMNINILLYFRKLSKEISTEYSLWYGTKHMKKRRF